MATETPPTSGTETSRASELVLDPNCDALEQIEASTDGDTIVGFAYIQGGVEYTVVDDHMRVTHEPHHVPRRKVLPSLSRQPTKIKQQRTETRWITVQGRHPDGSFFSNIEYQARKPEDTQPTRQPHIGLPSFACLLNDGIRRGTPADKAIRNPHFLEAPGASPLPETKTVPIDLRGRTGSVFEVVETVRQAESLPNLTGLSFSRDGYSRRIIADSTRTYSTRRSPTTWREVTIEIRDPDGHVVGRTKQRIEELERSLEVMATPPNEPLDDLRFVVPKSARDIELGGSRREAYRGPLGSSATTGPPEAPLVSVGEHLPLDDAVAMLACGDIYRRDSREYQELAAAIKSSIPGMHRVDALQKMVYEVGSGRLIELAQDMLAQYHLARKKLGLRSEPAANSLTSILEEMATRRWLADNPGGIDPDGRDKGRIVHNPADDGKAARLTRYNIVLQKLGKTLAANALQEKESPARKTVKIPEKGKPDEDHFKTIVVTNTAITINHAVLLSLQPEFRRPVIDILKPVETSDRDERPGKALSASDLILIGTQAGLATGLRLNN